MARDEGREREIALRILASLLFGKPRAGRRAGRALLLLLLLLLLLRASILANRSSRLPATTLLLRVIFLITCSFEIREKKYARRP